MTDFSALAGAGLGQGDWKNAAGSKRSMSKDDIRRLRPTKHKLSTIEDTPARSCRI